MASILMDWINLKASESSCSFLEAIKGEEKWFTPAEQATNWIVVGQLSSIFEAGFKALYCILPISLLIFKMSLCIMSLSSLLSQ